VPVASARRARYVRQARAAIAISTVRKIHLNMVLRYPPQRGLHEAYRWLDLLTMPYRPKVTAMNVTRIRTASMSPNPQSVSDQRIVLIERTPLAFPGAHTGEVPAERAQTPGLSATFAPALGGRWRE